MTRPDSIRALSEEFASAQLGDPRRTRRLMKVSDLAERAAGGSLPKQANGDASVLEGTYRLLSNEHIDPEAILNAHHDCTVERASELDEVVVAHDTTALRFGGEVTREGLGPLTDIAQGMYAHFSLALSRSGQPLGVLALRVWSRSGEPKPKRHPRDRGREDDRESLRWHEAIHEAAERLASKAQAIHVMDREADSYELLADLREHEQRFVVRVAHDRRLEKKRGARPQSLLYSALSGMEILLEREVQLSHRATPRGTAAKRRNPARRARTACLQVRAGSQRIARGADLLLHLPAVMELNFVEVVEQNPPEGHQPVVWRLVTSEPVSTPEQVAAVVDLYRMRWTIEEYFKALKTGCNFEKLQLESGRALVMALAVYSAVAWRLLLVRWMEREHPQAPASLTLTPVQLTLLASHRRKHNRPWLTPPTNQDVLLAIAALGGHLRNNGAPGWLVLSRGFRDLLLMEAGWHLAQAEYHKSSDQ
jgi:Transposase DDE domain/Transposase DNA-binding